MRCPLAICALLLAAITSCTRTPEAPAAPGVSANAPVSNNIVKVGDVDFSIVKNPEMIQPQFGFTPPEVDLPIILGIVRNEAKGTCSPVIMRKSGPAAAPWKIAEVAEAANCEWVYAAACPERRELWGILDLQPEAKAWQVTLIRSTDGGVSWQFFSAVKKPHNSGVYAGFSLAKNGAGRLTINLADDADGNAQGYYHYATTDGGKTWTGPTFEPDNITEADPMNTIPTIREAMKQAEEMAPGQ